MAKKKKKKIKKVSKKDLKKVKGGVNIVQKAFEVFGEDRNGGLDVGVNRPGIGGTAITVGYIIKF
jgi:tetrahydromethanopterin S-methyltransferase subunit F